MSLDPSLAGILDRLLTDHPPATTPPTEFLAARFDAGLAWVHWSPECGGADADPDQHGLLQAALREAGAPDPFPENPIGIGMVAPTIAHHGTAQQKTHLRRIFSLTDIWCQLFSEPGAGSDLASLATRADRDGDGWRVNGQKVWTSLGHKAAHGLLLARTDISAPKNRGLTTFLLDLTSPGVDIRPLRQMTGDAEFSEVYLDDVRLPCSARLGAEGDGWKVATTTLMNERVSIGSAFASTTSGPSAAMMRLFRERHAADPVVRDRVVAMYIESQVSRFMSLRAQGDPGPVGSVGKLFGAEHSQRINELVIDLLGAEGMLYPERAADRSPILVEGPDGIRDPHVQFLRSRANTIEGGTSEVMRNILAERILGLPREDSGDRNRPWTEIPRN